MGWLLLLFGSGLTDGSGPVVGNTPFKLWAYFRRRIY